MTSGNIIKQCISDKFKEYKNKVLKEYLTATENIWNNNFKTNDDILVEFNEYCYTTNKTSNNESEKSDNIYCFMGYTQGQEQVNNNFLSDQIQQEVNTMIQTIRDKKLTQVEQELIQQLRTKLLDWFTTIYIFCFTMLIIFLINIIIIF